MELICIKSGSHKLTTDKKYTIKGFFAYDKISKVDKYDDCSYILLSNDEDKLAFYHKNLFTEEKKESLKSSEELFKYLESNLENHSFVKYNKSDSNVYFNIQLKNNINIFDKDIKTYLYINSSPISCGIEELDSINSFLHGIMNVKPIEYSKNFTKGYHLTDKDYYYLNFLIAKFLFKYIIFYRLEHSTSCVIISVKVGNERKETVRNSFQIHYNTPYSYTNRIYEYLNQFTTNPSTDIFEQACRNENSGNLMWTCVFTKDSANI